MADDRICKNCKEFDDYDGGYCNVKRDNTDKYDWCKYFDAKSN